MRSGILLSYFEWLETCDCIEVVRSQLKLDQSGKGLYKNKIKYHLGLTFEVSTRVQLSVRHPSRSKERHKNLSM